MQDSDVHDGHRRRRRLRLVSYALAVFAVVAATYPWTTGAYTAWRQRALRGESVPAPVASAEESLESTATTGGPSPFEGWETQDLAYFRAQKSGDRFGILVIPKLGLDAVVIKGADEAYLKSGPGWIASTDYPGPEGNVGISGHRTTYAAPFRHLEDLEVGDVIEFHSPYRIYRYRVSRKLEVVPEDGSVMTYTEDPTITLSTCHPPYRAIRRLIVQGQLEAIRRLFPGRNALDE